MFWYRMLPTDTRPWKVTTDSETLVKEWKYCWQNKKSKLDKLLNILEPGLRHWEYLITHPYTPHISIVSLLALLDKHPTQAIHKINLWKNEVTVLSSIYEQMQLIVIKHIRTAKHFPTFANPRNGEYILAQEFKLKLKDNIKKLSKKHLNKTPYVDHLHGGIICPTYRDVILINKLTNTKWNKYIWYWIENNIFPKEITRYTHIPFDTFRKEVTQTWHFLRKNYSSGE